MEQQELILKKDARILWNEKKDVSGKYGITDIIVAEFTEEHNPQYLYKDYDNDIGNCLSKWDGWSNAYIIFTIFGMHDFTNQEVKNKAFGELMKIKELRNDIIDSYNCEPMICPGYNDIKK